MGFADLGILPPRDPGQRLAYLLDVAQGTDAMAAELRQLGGHADALVIDCNLSWALRSRVEPPTAVLVHTALGIYLPVWQAVLDTANAQRSTRGLPLLPAAADAWAQADLLLVASAAHFDQPVPDGRLRPVYVGPVSAPQPTRTGWDFPPAADPRRVLVSYSTDVLQNNPQRLQTALDALAELPVTVLATTSRTLDRSSLRIPANATVVDYVPHDAVIDAVALVVCHAGHGTTMAALTHGVPLVCVPGSGRDQGPIAQRVSELGIGIALPSDAVAPLIRDAAATILADDSYARRARAFAERMTAPDGAELAATEILALVRAP